LPDDEQPSAVPVPATSTSLHKKGKSRQESSLSEESPLENGPHSIKFLDTNEPQLSPSLQVPPLYSEAVNDGASVNLEDDEDDSKDMAPGEVEALYKLWRQIPEEKSPWESTASLLDKIRGVVITSKKPQH